MLRPETPLLFGLASLALAVGCDARSSLPGIDEGGSGGAASATTSGSTSSSKSATSAGSTSSTSGNGGAGGQPPCIDGQTAPCGSNVGQCKQGVATCAKNAWGPCVGEIGPTMEVCNGLDDNCDGQVDEGFGLGQACDGPDTDLCLDDVMTCNGCSLGANNLETCNGVDDNCNGIIDADCDTGDCQPSLMVTSSIPSNPSCIDFTVTIGSSGVIEYPCAGGMVTATLGGIAFSGSVANNFVSLDGTGSAVGPDGCTWGTHHHIGGVVSSGTLTYSYSEMVTFKPPNVAFCWSPCTETGTVSVTWN